jgi:hypothetical protein
MRMALIGIAAAVVTLAVDVQPSDAQKRGPRPWCVETGGIRGTDLDCMYWTRWQCEETARGIGYCVQNPRLGWDQRDKQRRGGS